MTGKAAVEACRTLNTQLDPCEYVLNGPLVHFGCTSEFPYQEYILKNHGLVDFKFCPFCGRPLQKKQEKQKKGKL
jgi:rRNA maturation endonuclease Nob1